MSCFSEKIEAGAVAVALNEAAGAAGCSLLIKNTGPETATIGGADMVFGTGFDMKEGEQIEVRLRHNHILYAITEEDDTTFEILRT